MPRGSLPDRAEESHVVGSPHELSSLLSQAQNPNYPAYRSVGLSLSTNMFRNACPFLGDVREENLK